jgi:glutathione S-transferase
MKTFCGFRRTPMIVLYSYPELFGVADNNGYGLKVFAFMRLAGLSFRHEHIFDASAAPRGQLPYITDDGVAIGDSEIIIAHLTKKYRLTIDAALTAQQRDTSHLVTRMLDDLYWVMSYSRWKDDRYWPAFRYAPNDAYDRGLADLRVLADLVPAQGYVHGAKPTSIDAGIYGFVANIYFYAIDTPLKQFVASQPNLVRHCRAIHEAVMKK